MESRIESPFLKVTATGHPVVLVAFSHIDTSPGHFAQSRVLDDLPYAKVFLNCPDNAYYLRPIPGVGDDVAAIAARLRGEIAALNPARVVLFGNSMGAYGALLYGALLGADLTLAMGPEVQLGVNGGAMLRAAKDRTISEDPHARSLTTILRAAPRGDRLCLFGEKAVADMRGALALSGTGVRAIGLRNAFHSIAPYLHGAVGLAPAIADLVEHGAACRWLGELQGDLLASPRLIDRLYEQVWENEPFGHFARLAAFISPTASRETLAYAWLAYGRELLAKGQRRHALALLLAATVSNPGDIEAYTLLVRVAEGRAAAAGIDRAALVAAVRAHRFDPTLTYCRFLAALLIEGENTPPEVLAAIAEARLSPRIESRVRLQLDRLLAEYGKDDAGLRRAAHNHAL
ncbi:MAG: hypothetical protein MUE49_10355 [Rhodospirillales bacterium]|nr:hypothetical protein [Rhodospirillales bacterium]